MAIKTNNGPKANPGEIKQVINFIKELLPNSLVRLISILLHPCCDLDISGVAITCGDTAYNIVFTLASPLTYSQTVSATVSNTEDGTVTVSQDGKTVTVTDATITSVPGTFNVVLFYPTTGGNSGVYRAGSIGVTSSDVPSC